MSDKGSIGTKGGPIGAAGPDSAKASFSSVDASAPASPSGEGQSSGASVYNPSIVRGSELATNLLRMRDASGIMYRARGLVSKSERRVAALLNFELVVFILSLPRLFGPHVYASTYVMFFIIGLFGAFILIGRYASLFINGKTKIPAAVVASLYWGAIVAFWSPSILWIILAGLVAFGLSGWLHLKAIEKLKDTKLILGRAARKAK